MKCAILLVGVVLFCLFKLNHGLEKENFQCAENGHYQENECNNCRCLGGDLACTRRQCKSHEGPALRDCEVGTTWAKACNKCWCVEGFHTVCTAEKC